MSTGGYKIINKEAIHFITFAVAEWVDVFTRKEYLSSSASLTAVACEWGGLGGIIWFVAGQTTQLLFLKVWLTAHLDNFNLRSHFFQTLMICFEDK